MVEIHYKIGLTQESKKYAKVLGYNYQSSEWYKQSYKVFNKDYEVVKKKVKKKRKKGLIWKKFKSLFKKWKIKQVNKPKLSEKFSIDFAWLSTTFLIYKQCLLVISLSSNEINYEEYINGKWTSSYYYKKQKEK